MDRRHPFDPTGGARQNQLTNSAQAQQLRAALGLEDFYLQQQQQHQVQQQQHDAQIRLRLLHEQQIERARSASFSEYPSDLQQRLHRSMLLNDHLAAQQQQQQQQAALLRVEQAHAEERLLLRRQQLLGSGFHPDDASAILDSSQRERFPPINPMDAVIETALHGEHQRQLLKQREDQVRAILSTYQTRANTDSVVSELVGAATIAAAEHSLQQEQEQEQKQRESQELLRSLSRNSNASSKKSLSRENISTPSPSNVQQEVPVSDPSANAVEENASERQSPAPGAAVSRKKRRSKSLSEKGGGESKKPQSKRKKTNGSTTPSSNLKNETILAEAGDASSSLLLPQLPFITNLESTQQTSEQKNNENVDECDQSVTDLDYSLRSTRTTQSYVRKYSEGDGDDDDDDNDVIMVEDDVIVVDSQQNDEEESATVVAITKGSIDDLIRVSEDVDVTDDAANILVTSIGKAEIISESDSVNDDDEVYITNDEGMKVKRDFSVDISFPIDSPDPSTTFTCRICQLPEEPLLIEDESDSTPLDNKTTTTNRTRRLSEHDEMGNESTHSKAKMKRNAVVEYPFCVDTWWPSVSGLKKELRDNGENSDEDAFDDDVQNQNSESNSSKTLFRANVEKIQRRLKHSLEPGVLEKLPHCMIHRVRSRRKKNSTAPELVYCWQVTELYPNDVMVNCSQCGTWRHAACGGHHRPYSSRENTYKPFIAVCDYCSEEGQHLIDNPIGARRLERQRTEQLRRALGTSSVMRHASISKHSGTYKWPLGSVSATHIGGHTRSVHARHDKAEKQWTEMANRLGRGYGYRVKERIKSRTKEFERLLVSIEDAESYTDRHNMLLFLQRDTVRDKPAGLEHPFGIIFDPADDNLFESSHKATSPDGDDDDDDENDDDDDKSDSNGETKDKTIKKHFLDDWNDNKTNTANKKKNGQLNGMDKSEQVNGNDFMVMIATGQQKNDIDEPYQLPSESDVQDIDENSNGCAGGVVASLSTNIGNDKYVCIRIDCTQRRRFDSQFCSDACGVLCLEQDLLRTLQDAIGIHPSVLRL